MDLPRAFAELFSGLKMKILPQAAGSSNFSANHLSKRYDQVDETNVIYLHRAEKGEASRWGATLNAPKPFVLHT